MATVSDLVELSWGRLSRLERQLFLVMWPLGAAMLLIGHRFVAPSVWDSSPLLLEVAGSAASFMVGFPVAVAIIAPIIRRTDGTAAGRSKALSLAHGTAELTRRAAFLLLSNSGGWEQPTMRHVALARDAARALDELASAPGFTDAQDGLAQLRKIVPPFDWSAIGDAQIVKEWDAFLAIDAPDLRSLQQSVLALKSSWQVLESRSALWSDVRHAAVIPQAANISTSRIQACLQPASRTYEALADFLTSAMTFASKVVDEWPVLSFEAGLSSLSQTP